MTLKDDITNTLRRAIHVSATLIGFVIFVFGAPVLFISIAVTYNGVLIGIICFLLIIFSLITSMCGIDKFMEYLKHKFPF